MFDTIEMAQSKITKINSQRPELLTIQEARSVLDSNGLVVSPTDTLYGILAKIDSPEAVNRLFEAKGRNFDKPSAIFVQSVSEIEKMAELTPKATALCRKFLPGALTIVLKSKLDLGPRFTKEGKSGFRISASPIISKLVGLTGPLSSTSANLSGQGESEEVEAIYAQMGDKIDLYLDGGRLNNPPSTVVEIIDEQVKILRKGAIAEKDILAALE